MTTRSRVAGGLMLLAAALAGPASSPAQTPLTERIHGALAVSDSQEAYDAVVAFYREAGVSWGERIVIDLKSYDHVFNYYDHRERTIVIGAIPTPDQSDHYWKNWSKTLTGGQWGAGFESPEASHRLAAYNQLVLFAHEAGHALMFRYDPDHNARHGYDVNCRELYADRLATALMRDLSDSDPRFAALEADYLDLIASFNRAISPIHRYRIETVKALINTCDLIVLDQPTPDTLAPYASAYFERQTLLLNADLPDLARVYGHVLFPPLDALRAQFPPRPGVGALKTHALYPDWPREPDRVQDSEGQTIERRQHLATLAPDGTPWRVDVSVRWIDDAQGRTAALTIAPGAPEGPFPDLGLEIAADDRCGLLEAIGALALSADRLLIAGEMRWCAKGDTLVLIVLERDEAGAWRARHRSLGRDGEAALAHDNQGGAVLYQRRIRSASDGGNYWAPFALDPESLDPGPALPHHSQIAAFAHGMPDGSGGHILELGSNLVWVGASGGNWQRIAGSFLEGLKDNASATEAELIAPGVMVRKEDGTLVFLDPLPGPQGYAVRQIRLPGLPVPER